MVLAPLLRSVGEMSVLGEQGEEYLSQLSEFSYAFEKIIKILCVALPRATPLSRRVVFHARARAARLSFCVAWTTWRT